MTHRHRRVLIALVTLASGLWAWIAHTLPGSSVWDAGQLYLGVRAIVLGQDPYAVVAERLPFPLFYPLPALLLFAPFAAMPEAVARVGWAMLQGGVFAWAAARYRPLLLIGLLSASYLDALVLGQWSPLLTAAALVPVLGFVWAAKPTIGAMLFAAFPSRPAAIGVVVVALLSFLVLPGWPQLWLEAVRQQIHAPPVLRPGGVLLLASLLRWRIPEARLVAAFALVPHTTGLYDALPLFLVPRQRREGYILAALTLVAAFIAPELNPWRREEGQSLAEHLNHQWPLMFGLVYLPALFMVLRMRPGSPSGSA